MLRLPIDWPNLKISPRFLKHGVSGTIFADLNWAISLLLKNSVHAHRMIISCGTINLATRLTDWMESHIPLTWLNRENVIKPYHSLLSPEYRTNTITALDCDTGVKIVPATDCISVGIDVDVPLIVLLKLEDTFEGLAQWMGRAGRRSPGLVIAYAPDWMRKETPAELSGMSQKTLGERQTKRESVSKSLVNFFNPTKDMCSRGALSEGYGEVFVRPTSAPCCDFCDPDPFHLNENELFEETLQPPPHPALVLRSDRTFTPLSKTTLRPEAVRALKQWQLNKWTVWTAEAGNIVFGPSVLLLDHALGHLCDKLHIITTYKRFAAVMSDWDRLEEYGEELFNFALKLMRDLHEKFRITNGGSVASTQPLSGTQGETKAPLGQPCSLPDEDLVSNGGAPSAVSGMGPFGEVGNQTVATDNRTSQKRPLSPQKPRRAPKRKREDQENLIVSNDE